MGISIKSFYEFSTKNKLATVPSLIVTILGLIVITGWVLDLPVLIQLHNSLVPMQFNTAICMVFGGLAGLACLFEKVIFCRVLAALLCFISGLTLLEYATGVNYGIDEFFIEAKITTLTRDPGRMAPNTAVCFLLAGISQILITVYSNSIARLMTNVVLVMLVTSFAMIALFGYATGLEATYGWGDMTKMAVHTAVGFVLLGLTQLGFIWQEFMRKCEKHLSIPVSILIFFTAVYLWQAMKTEEVEKFRAELKSLANAEVINATTYLGYMDAAMDRLVGRLNSDADKIDSVPLKNDLLAYMDDFSGILAFGILSTEQNSNYLVIKKKAAFEFNLDSYLASFESEFMRSVETEHIKILSVGDSKELLVFIYELENSGIQYNKAYFVVETNALFDRLYNRFDSPYLGVSVYDDEKQVFYLDALLDEESDKYIVSVPMEFEGYQWQIDMIPSAAYLDNNQSDALHFILVVGVVLSLLIASIIYMAQKIQLKNQSLEQVLAERDNALNDAEKGRLHYSSIFNAVGKGILTLDAAGRIQDLNLQVENITGYSRDELLGMNSLEMLPSKLKKFFSQMIIVNEDVQQQGMFNREIKIINASNEYVTINLTITVKNIESPRTYICVLSDMSEEIALRKILQSQNDKLLYSNEALKQFAYIASHDLQEPLRVVSSFTELLASKLGSNSDETVIKYMGFITDGANRMQKMIRGLLHYSKLDKGKDEMEYVSLSVCIQSALNNLQTLILENNCVINVNLDNMPTIICDEIQLSQVFQNLISNSIKYRGDKAPVVTITAQYAAGYWEVCVADNGEGIDPKFNMRIFELFQRLHTKAHSDGTGLGLAICKKIIDRHQGKIWVSSAPGEGSRFYFTLPSSHQKVL